MLRVPTLLGTFVSLLLADARSDAVDRVLAGFSAENAPGCAIGVIQNSRFAYKTAFGLADLQGRAPLATDTPFNIASMSKQFTAAALFFLVEEGKVRLHDPVRRYVPELPLNTQAIEVADLLHHTSGLRDWPETLGFSGLDMEGPITLDTILEMVRRQRELDFAPGEEHLYSNTGYNLLAAAVAKVTGQSFRAWTDANLFRPLGMKHTLVCDDSAEVVAKCANSYAPGDQGKFHRVNSQLSAQGSSSLFINAEDMGKWLLNFETARVGGKSAIEMMHQPGKLNGGAKVNYGFGVGLVENRGIRMIVHTGGWAAYRSVVLRIPEKRLALGAATGTPASAMSANATG
jgi:CubicO group peptidase (beta-lactamase class C family)